MCQASGCCSWCKRSPLFVCLNCQTPGKPGPISHKFAFALCCSIVFIAQLCTSCFCGCRLHGCVQAQRPSAMHVACIAQQHGCGIVSMHTGSLQGIALLSGRLHFVERLHMQTVASCTVSGRSTTAACTGAMTTVGSMVLHRTLLAVLRRLFALGQCFPGSGVEHTQHSQCRYACYSWPDSCTFIFPQVVHLH